ncbi:MAG: (E)-4-hydroxy-3-methylbut-2-enyl-diphosphate synthase [Candidatus Latescibacterota bacterium]|nr:MAG: (E)-4-hydroxy-3-methylbut-2-enyl-diphosphate synthase [Candidatus Latescibacterota bacterium]
MPQAFVREAPRTAAEWRALWSYTRDPFRTVRRPTREVRVGGVGIGGSNPIRIQSMTIADTLDTAAVVDEIATLARAGSEIVRVTTPHLKAAENLANIRSQLRRRNVHVPLVADVHFTPKAALIAAEHVEKVRINPGNYADRKHFKKWEYSDAEYADELERLEAAFRPLVLRCKERGCAMRIGTNHGSLSDRILNRYGDTPQGMVESALEFVRICEHHGYRDIVLSMKASDVKVMIEAYRMLARRMRELDMEYPMHLGVTEAGAGLAARVKSAIGIGALLDDGIGDTIRVSLTEDSVHEIPVARAIVAASGQHRESSLRFAAGEPPWDPCFFERRRVQALGSGPTRLASDQPPRIELLQEIAADTHDVPAWLETAACDAAEAGADLLLVGLPQESGAVERALDAAAEWTRAARTPLALGVELDLALLEHAGVRRAFAAGNWSRLSARAWAPGAQVPEVPVQYLLRATPAASRRLAQALQEGTLPLGAVALVSSEGAERDPPLHAWRALLAAWPAGAPATPVVLRAPHEAEPVTSFDRYASEHTLWLAAQLGGLLADGVGDAVQLVSRGGPEAATLAREILQATRMRLSHADFIACPSCGRTQFDLQSTTARIETRLRHLKGLKIAIMGCIVNGPGEMADADFGYVGSGPGRIDLYVGHERVERGVAEAQAVDRLVDLIRRHGRWVEPS